MALQAWVDMTQVRDEPFVVNTAADSDQSKPDGSFCIRYVRPGKYLLTAERLDVKDCILNWQRRKKSRATRCDRVALFSIESRSSCFPVKLFGEGAVLPAPSPVN
jgi:hypothetical protein